ncbi:MAG TPA: hypothetical protein VKY85_23605 [Candidatus Angelobacter sp.]|nr:hypothetical protein [Candidatus Angelobacter sp.]
MKAKPAVSQKMNRRKLSITVSTETHDFLQQMVKQGRAATMGEALDQIVRKVRRVENRARLAAATTEYFEQLSPQSAAEERVLSRDLSLSAQAIDLDSQGNAE